MVHRQPSTYSTPFLLKFKPWYWTPVHQMTRSASCWPGKVYILERDFSLTIFSKTFYSLANAKEVVSLEHTDSEPLCDSSQPKPQDHSQYWQWRYRHRQECHNISWTEANKRREAEGLSPRPLKKCRTGRYASNHCECFVMKDKLHNRLTNWMPEGVKYCKQCQMFTKRKRQHKGKCEQIAIWKLTWISWLWIGYHGQQKKRRYEGNFWTHRPRKGAFGRKLWRKWFNNQAMDRLERRLSSDAIQRTGTARYELRTLKSKKLDTQEVRDSNSHVARWVGY